MTCDDRCIKDQAKWRTALHTYVSAWPLHCKTCEGVGGIVYRYSPAGVSLAPGTMQGFDPCPDCIEEGVCPRCGEVVFSEEAWDAAGEVTCPDCGWNSETPAACPEQPECLCWIET